MLPAIFVTPIEQSYQMYWKNPFNLKIFKRKFLIFEFNNFKTIGLYNTNKKCCDMTKNNSFLPIFNISDKKLQNYFTNFKDS